MGEQDGKLAFDFDEFAREEGRERLDEWAGAPLRFVQDYYSPELLDEAFEYRMFLNGISGSHGRSHMWHRTHRNPEGAEFGAHRGELFNAELRPEYGEEGPGGLLAEMVCEPCQRHAIEENENSVVEQWHDHAVPGWRDLPIVPASIWVRDGSSLTKRAMAWIWEHYPQHMQVLGAPNITESQPVATRHVPNYSPWNGFDLAFTALGREPIGLDDDAYKRDTAHLTRPGRTETGRAI